MIWWKTVTYTDKKLLVHNSICSSAYCWFFFLKQSLEVVQILCFLMQFEIHVDEQCQCFLSFV